MVKGWDHGKESATGFGNLGLWHVAMEEEWRKAVADFRYEAEHGK